MSFFGEPGGGFLGLLGGGDVTIIRGRVAANGAVTAGTGFTANRTSLGHYTITFDVPFAAVPVFLAIAFTDEVTFSGSVFVVTATAAAIAIVIGENASAARIDSPFHFAAISIT